MMEDNSASPRSSSGWQSAADEVIILFWECRGAQTVFIQGE